MKYFTSKSLNEALVNRLKTRGFAATSAQHYYFKKLEISAALLLCDSVELKGLHPHTGSCYKF